MEIGEALKVIVPATVSLLGICFLTYRYLDTRLANQVAELRAQIAEAQNKVAAAEKDIATLRAQAITSEHLDKALDRIEGLLTRELTGLRAELRNAHGRLDWFMGQWKSYNPPVEHPHNRRKSDPPEGE